MKRNYLNFYLESHIHKLIIEKQKHFCLVDNRKKIGIFGLINGKLTHNDNKQNYLFFRLRSLGSK